MAGSAPAHVEWKDLYSYATPRRLPKAITRTEQIAKQTVLHPYSRWLIRQDLIARRAQEMLEPVRVADGTLWIIAHRRGQSTQHDKQDEEDGEEDDDFAHGRVLGAVLGPGAAALRQVFLEGGAAELVVDEAAEGDAVAEELEGRDFGAPDPHGGCDEEDVF